MKKGFSVCLDGQRPVVALSDSGVNVIVHVGRKRSFLQIGGMDSKYNHLRWEGSPLKPGDRIVIRAAESAVGSPLTESYPWNREELKGVYERMKKQLAEKGLL